MSRRWRRCANVRLLGKRLHSDVPRYIKAFDVAVIPYEFSEYTASVYPTKLNEYLAMGMPVVSTDLPEIRRFNGDHGDIVAVASDPEDFVRAIGEAMAERLPTPSSRRLEVARENSWERRIERMSEVIDETLAARDQVDLPVAGAAAPRLSGCAPARRRVDGGAGLELLRRLSHAVRLERCRAAAASRTPPVRSDAVVVFAGGVGESGRAGGGYQERVKQAVDLYRAGMADYAGVFLRLRLRVPRGRGDARPRGRERRRPAAIVLETQGGEHVRERRVHARHRPIATVGGASCSSARRTTCAARC